MSTTMQTVVQQQAVVAELGLFALRETDLQRVMDRAVVRVAETLEVEFCKILERIPSEEALLLRSGVGWKNGYVGRARVGTERDSQAGYTLLAEEPVIVDNLREESRFSGPPLLIEHGIVSGISAVIESSKTPYGVMGAHTTEHRQFTQGDAYFLQSVANVIGEAIERTRAYEKLEQRVEERTADLQKKNTLIRLMQRVTSAANEASHLSDALQFAVNSICRQTGWPVGHVYRRSGADIPKLKPTTLWNGESDKKFGELSRVTESKVFAEGEGLPGRVLRTGEPAWISDVREDPNFPRAELAVDLGVRGAFAFPVLLEEEVVAVLEFFSREPQPPDEHLLDTMGSIGVQLGRVAERETAAEELEASEKRHRSLMETAADGIIVADNDGRIIDWNRGAREIFGYRAEEAVGQPLEILMPERYQEAHHEGMKRVNETGEGRILGRTVELSGLRKNGEEFPLELSLSTWTVGDDRFYASIIRDITERKRAENALRESEQRFRTLAEQSQVGIVLIQDGTYRYVNPAYAEIFGYDPEELVGESPRKIAHPTDWPLVENNLHRRLSGEEESIRYAFRGKTRDGETVHLDVYGGRIQYRGKTAVIGTAVDVTDKRRLEQEILQIQEQERRRIGQDLHDRIGSNLSGIAMMLRSTMNGLDERDAPEGETLEEIVKLVQDTTNDARRLSRGLNPVQLDKEGLSAALKRLATNTTNRMEIACRYEEDPALPRLPNELTSHLYWIAQEATMNAARHSRAEHIWIRLRKKEDDRLVLSIDDDGTGFDPSETHDGMGLHTMRYRAEVIRGRFEIQQQPGGGTRVYCEVPL